MIDWMEWNDWMEDHMKVFSIKVVNNLFLVQTSNFLLEEDSSRTYTQTTSKKNTPNHFQDIISPKELYLQDYCEVVTDQKARV